MKNAINWFEIPVTDLNAAKAFYEAVLQKDLRETEGPDGKLALFPTEGQTGGALVEQPNAGPAKDGILILLNAWGPLDEALVRVEQAGGKVLKGKDSLGENGFRAIFEDPMGNRMGLHSMN